MGEMGTIENEEGGRRWDDSAVKSSINSFTKYQPMDRKRNSRKQNIKSIALLPPNLKRRSTKNLTLKRIRKNIFPLNQIFDSRIQFRAVTST